MFWTVLSYCGVAVAIVVTTIICAGLLVGAKEEMNKKKDKDEKQEDDIPRDSKFWQAVDKEVVRRQRPSSN